MTIAIGQMKITAGAPAVNKQIMLDMVRQAAAAGAELIVFPELAVSGFLCGDLLGYPAFIEECERAGEELAAASQNGIRIVFGNLGRDHRGRVANAVFLAEQGQLRCMDVLLDETALPTGDDHFVNHNSAQVCNIEIDGLPRRIAFSLSDWRQPPAQIFGVDLIIDLTLRPLTLEDGALPQPPRGCRYLSVNAYSLQNSGKTCWLFAGGSSYWDEGGRLLADAGLFQSGLFLWHYDTGGERSAAWSADDLLLAGLTSGVRCFTEQIRARDAVIGLSGGIDSALAAAIYTDVLGPDHVHLISMPTHFNSQTTKSLAARMADGLGCRFAEMPIENAVHELFADFERLRFTQQNAAPTGVTLSPLARENVMARDRCRLLAAAAAAVGGIFTCNGNKAELTVGYATFYGDLAGAFAAQADLWKFQVYQAAAAFQRLYPAAPLNEIAAIRPSAELSDAQAVDQGLGDPLHYAYHDYLLRWWVEQGADIGQALTHYLDGTLAERIGCAPQELQQACPDRRAFVADCERWWKAYRGMGIPKRIQAPPLLALSRHPFGEPLPQAQGPVWFPAEYEALKGELGLD